jgi:hypothetical protein
MIKRNIVYVNSVLKKRIAIHRFKAEVTDVNEIAVALKVYFKRKIPSPIKYTKKRQYQTVSHYIPTASVW